MSRPSISWKIGLLTSFWMAAFIGTHLPKVPNAITRVSDKTLHCLAFVILAALLSWVLQDRVQGWLRHAVLVLVTLSIYGAVDELLQIPVGRHCDVWDWVTDVIGTVLGLILFHLLRLLYHRYRIVGTSHSR